MILFKHYMNENLIRNFGPMLRVFSHCLRISYSKLVATLARTLASSLALVKDCLRVEVEELLPVVACRPSPFYQGLVGWVGDEPFQVTATRQRVVWGRKHTHSKNMRLYSLYTSLA